MSILNRFVLVFAALIGGLISQAKAGTVTCEQGSEAVCIEYCDHVGGGMGSNPDGSVTCHILRAEEAAANFKKLNDNDWLLVLVPQKAPPPAKH